MIYFDPSESRERSKLSYMVIQHGKPLEGLEEKTGGDILVTSSVIPGGTVLRPPGSIFLEKACEKAFLIQRKSGEDMLHSIPNLKDILRRMRECPSMPWLAISGHFDESISGKVVVNGFETGWQWSSYKGVKQMWQIYGGRIEEKSTDEELGEWILQMDETWLKRIQADEFFTRDTVDTTHLIHDLRPWRAVLEGFPDVKAKRSYQIADLCGDLKTALWWMSLPDETMKGTKEEPGIGKTTKEKWRKYMGLADDEILMPVKIDTGEPTGEKLAKLLEVA